MESDPRRLVHECMDIRAVPEQQPYTVETLLLPIYGQVTTFSHGTTRHVVLQENETSGTDVNEKKERQLSIIYLRLVPHQVSIFPRQKRRQGNW